MKKLKCFVAMAFGKGEVEQIYEDGIKPVLDSLGITPIRVDLVNHNDLIDNKIREEIETSSLMVADLTFARPSVYWEAGFARRVSPVIYSCRADHFERRSKTEDPCEERRVHFDLEHEPIISWQPGNLAGF